MGEVRMERRGKDVVVVFRDRRRDWTSLDLLRNRLPSPSTQRSVFEKLPRCPRVFQGSRIDKKTLLIHVAISPSCQVGTCIDHFRLTGLTIYTPTNTLVSVSVLSGINSEASAADCSS
jgi:hypothetical protein